MKKTHAKFQNNQYKTIRAVTLTRFCDRQSSKGNNSKSINARVMVLALCTLSNIDDIYMKFQEDSLNSFQVIEQTRFYDRVQGNNSESIKARVMVLALCMSSNVD